MRNKLSGVYPPVRFDKYSRKDSDIAGYRFTACFFSPSSIRFTLRPEFLLGARVYRSAPLVSLCQAEPKANQSLPAKSGDFD